jgi:hypothetical protein
MSSLEFQAISLIQSATARPETLLLHTLAYNAWRCEEESQRYEFHFYRKSNRLCVIPGSWHGFRITAT